MKSFPASKNKFISVLAIVSLSFMAGHFYTKLIQADQPTKLTSLECNSINHAAAFESSYDNSKNALSKTDNTTAIDESKNNNNIVSTTSSDVGGEHNHKTAPTKENDEFHYDVSGHFSENEDNNKAYSLENASSKAEQSSLEQDKNGTEDPAENAFGEPENSNADAFRKAEELLKPGQIDDAHALDLAQNLSSKSLPRSLDGSIKNRLTDILRGSSDINNKNLALANLVEISSESEKQNLIVEQLTAGGGAIESAIEAIILSKTYYSEPIKEALHAILKDGDSQYQAVAISAVMAKEGRLPENKLN